MVAFSDMKRPRLMATLATLGLASCGGPVDPPATVESDEELAAAESALERLAAAYDELTGMVDEGSDQAVDRVRADLENLGDWEYQIIELPGDSAATIAEELNALGDERWEAYWVERSNETVRIYLKRPAISYAGRVPIAALLRLLAAGV